VIFLGERLEERGERGQEREERRQRTEVIGTN